MLDELDSERFADCSPYFVYATLLDEGRYIGSVREPSTTHTEPLERDTDHADGLPRDQPLEFTDPRLDAARAGLPAASRTGPAGAYCGIVSAVSWLHFRRCMMCARVPSVAECAIRRRLRIKRQAIACRHRPQVGSWPSGPPSVRSRSYCHLHSRDAWIGGAGGFSSAPCYSSPV